MDAFIFAPQSVKEVYAKSVMLCGRGLCTTHMHRPITTYFLDAKIRTISIPSKFWGREFVNTMKNTAEGVP